MDDWVPHAHRLADALAAVGHITDPRVAAAVRDVPRHVFVPTYHRQGADGIWTEHTALDDLAAVYRDTVLVTVYSGVVALSSSSQPGLMTRMIESLDLADGMRVLEIGTGTGYNAALLSHRLGDANVYSVDIEADLVALARERLAGLGHHPTLVVGDGSAGLPEHAPFDAVVATCAVPTIPWAWIEQTVLGGVVLTDLKAAPGAGSLVRLVRTATDRAEGRFDAVYAAFMSLRHGPGPPPGFHVDRDPVAASHRTTTLDPVTPWSATVVWFLASFALGPEIAFGYAGAEHPIATRIATPDGSWADVTHAARAGRHAVAEGGPRRLWRIVEDAHRTWTELGRPGWDRFGLTVTPARQTVWFDDPEGPSWPLRLPGTP